MALGGQGAQEAAGAQGTAGALSVGGKSPAPKLGIGREGQLPPTPITDHQVGLRGGLHLQGHLGYQQGSW